MLNNVLSPKRVLWLILILAFVVRLYGFTNPIADWHSWRQADTSAVSRNFIKQGYDILHPRFDDLSNVASGKDNPQGYRFVEFPIYNLLQAGLFQLIGILTLEEWGRIVTIISSLFSIALIYLLVKKFANVQIALLSAGIYAFLPYTIYYGRVILPDPSMVTASLAAVYFFDMWSDANRPKDGWLVGSVIAAALALLLKPYAVFFLLPIVYLAFIRFKYGAFLQWRLWLFAIVSVLPLALWRLWMAHYPEGIPANAWLLNGNGIRFRPAFFRWIGYERLTKLISGYAGILLLIPGTVLIFKNKKLWFFLSLITGSILYVVIFATGNVQHDYYQILIMPTVVMVMGIGASWVVNRLNKIYSYLGFITIAIIFILSWYFSWQEVRGYFYINNPSIVTAGKAVDRLTPKDAKVVALYDGDTSFLYQTNRQGWPALENGLPDLIKKGADYLVFANPTPDNYKLGTPFKIIAQTKQYVIFDLHSQR